MRLNLVCLEIANDNNYHLLNQLVIQEITQMHIPALAIALLAMTFVNELSASEAQPSDSTIEEVVVIGSVLYRDQINALKTPTPIIDVPQSVAVITGAEIQSRGYASISDLIHYVPGLSSSQGEGHRDAVVVRGVRSTADFFVDGVRDDVQYYRPLYNLDQVEVLKGPNALLFGRGGYWRCAQSGDEKGSPRQ